MKKQKKGMIKKTIKLSGYYQKENKEIWLRTYLYRVDMGEKENEKEEI